MGLFGKKKTEDKVEDKVQKKVEDNSAVKKTDMLVSGDEYGIIISSIVTEKSHKMSQEGKYLFKVSSGARKSDIKKSIEGVYKVDVDKVNVLTVSNKRRTIKYDRGYQKAYKKAIVTLGEGQSITVFEGE